MKYVPQSSFVVGVVMRMPFFRSVASSLAASFP